MKKSLVRIKDFLAKRYKRSSRKILSFIDRRPLQSFFITLGVVLVFIIIGSLLPKPKQEVIKVENIKKVETYHIGTAPKITVQAQIKKSGVIQITAQTGGIISNIHVTEGSKISRGALLLNIASNYYGGNAATLQRQIAQKQDESVQSTYNTQKELIQKQKDIAQKTDENSDQLRDITSKSIDETQSLIDLNQQTINLLDQEIAAAPTSSTLKGTKGQILNSLNQARAAIRSSQYQSAADKPPAQLADLTRETTIKQLEVQEKQLGINKEITHLQLLLAQVNEGVYYPAAPFSGIVERVFVKQFDAVTPGTPLMIISQTKEDDPVTAVAFVSKDIANRASRLEESVLHIGDKTISLAPSFISTEAVQGTLYAIYFSIPDSLNKGLTNEGFITVDIPVGHPDSLASAPFVPIDAVYQTANSSYLFVVDGEKAKSKEVKLGQVMGRFVSIEQGIDNNDTVILNRNVIEGDKINLQ